MPRFTFQEGIADWGPCSRTAAPVPVPVPVPITTMLPNQGYPSASQIGRHSARLTKYAIGNDPVWMPRGRAECSLCGFADINLKVLANESILQASH